MVDGSYTAIELSEGSDLRSPPPTHGSDKPLVTQFTTTSLPARDALETSYKATQKVVVWKRLLRTHLPVLALLVVFGILPMILFFKYTDRPFVPEDQLCQTNSNNDNDKPTIQGLVTIDGLLISLPFGAAKLLDTAFDLFVGRGTQLIAALIAYDVFTKAMMRTIETSPTPYRTFLGLSLNGVGLMTLWYMIKDIRRHKTKRSTFLFSWIILSSIYVLALSTILSAMSGYVSSVKEYIPTDDSQLIPVDQVTDGYIVEDASRIGGSNGSCYSSDSGIYQAKNVASDRLSECPCLLPNGTFTYPGIRAERSSFVEMIKPYTWQDCQYEKLGSNYTFYSYTPGDYRSVASGNYYNCSAPLNVTVNDHFYDIGYSSLNITGAYCLKGKGISYAEYSYTICMPFDGGNYHWGFSRMLTAVFLIVHAVWSVSMYIVWLDAMLFSELVKRGFSLTQLRGAFTVVAAAQDRLDTEADNLITVPTKEVDKFLFDKESVIDQKYLAKERDEGLFDHMQPHDGV